MLYLSENLLSPKPKFGEGRRKNGHSFTDSFLFFCYLVIEDDREIKLYSFYIANILKQYTSHVTQRATPARGEIYGPMLPAQVANQKTASSWAVLLKKHGKPAK